MQQRYKGLQQTGPDIEEIKKMSEEEQFSKWSKMIMKAKGEKDYLAKSKKELKEKMNMDKAKFQEKLERAKVYRKND